MLDARFIRENLDLVESRLKSRGTGVDLERFRQIDARRRELMQQGESLKALRNRVSEEISKVRDKSQVQGQILEMREVSQQIKGLDEELRGIEEEFDLF